MLVCRDFATLLSESCDRPLDRRTRLRVRLHVMLCGPCRRYGWHLSSLMHLLRVLVARRESLGPEVHLSAAARARIIAAMTAGIPPAPETDADHPPP